MLENSLKSMCCYFKNKCGRTSQALKIALGSQAILSQKTLAVEHISQN